MAVSSYLARSRAVSLGIVVGALLLAVLVVQTGLANVTRYRASEDVLRWAPGDARALAGASEVVLTADAGPQERARAADYARAAIRRDPTLGTPFRVLGFIADANGDRAAARALITHAELLSRRDLPTQLWLIDDAVARSDMKGALTHFDTALRTSLLAPTVLFPVLGKALSEPEIVDALAGTLAARPSWRDRFLADAIDKSPELAGLVRLSDQLRMRRTPLDAAQQRQLLNRLTEARAFGLVARMRPSAVPGAALGQAVIDPGFDADTGIFPFAWTLTEQDGLSARREGATEGATALRLAFRADIGRGGELARQLLVLKPGRYRLQWLGGHDAPDALGAPVWSVSCADGPPRSLLSGDMAVGAGTQRGSGEFTVPASGCQGQWLGLAARASTKPGGLNGWVDRVEITGG